MYFFTIGGFIYMERKKLYKAKKNWVIGLATGLAIMALGTNIAYADNNTSNEPVVTTQQANAGTQQTNGQQEQVNVQPENTIGMSSNVASNPIGSYNKDNVGYANPNSEEQYYDALQEHAHHLSHQGSYKYPYKLLDKFAQKDDLLKKNMYRTPDVYEYLGDSNNPYKNVKPKQITEIKSKINTDITVHYLNNGVSNSIQITNTQGDHNYEAINSLSQALSYADYKLLTYNYSQPRNDQNYGRFFDGNKPIVTPSPMLSTQDLNALYKAAYKNRPIITFDGWSKSGHHITSFLQSSIESFDDGWNLTFDNGWRGYTFMDGSQIAFVETNKARGILRNKGKNFSWKNTVLKYFAESLAYKNSVAEEVDQNTPYMLVGRNYIPVTDILTSRKSNRLENPFNISPTEIVFADKGVYAIINGAMGGYDPILVHVPMAFLKQKYQDFYSKSEALKNLTNNKKDTIDTEDISKDNIEFINKEEGNEGNEGIGGIDVKAKRASQISYIPFWKENKGPKVHDHDNGATHLASFFNGLKEFKDDIFENINKGVTYIISKLSVTALHMADDARNLYNDVKKIMKNESLIKKEPSGVLGLSGDIVDTGIALHDMNEAEDNNGGKGNNHQKFNTVRNAHMTVNEKIINFLSDLADSVKVNPPLTIVLATLTGLIAVAGAARIATWWSALSGEDSKLLKRFKLKKK